MKKKIKKTSTSKWYKTKPVKGKIAYCQYFECPYCKKMVIYTLEEFVKAMRKWRKQKPKKKSAKK